MRVGQKKQNTMYSFGLLEYYLMAFNLSFLINYNVIVIFEYQITNFK